MPCTAIRPGDMADNILDRDKHPEWNGERTKMVYAFPADEKLWQQYAELRADSLRRELLARDLKAFFRIDGEPIVAADNIKGWQTVFALSADDWGPKTARVRSRECRSSGNSAGNGNERL